MKSLVIIGAGDLGKELVWLIEDINKRNPTYLILGFLDDDIGKDTYSFCGYKVLGGTNQLETLNEKIPLSAVIAIRDGKTRKKIVENHPDYKKWETIIHPSAVIASSTKIGRGCVFFPHVTVSVDTYLGNFGLFYINSTVCNDCWIGDYVSIMANASVSEHAELASMALLKAGECIEPFYRFSEEGKK